MIKTKTKLKLKNNWKTKTKTKNKSKRKSHCHIINSAADRRQRRLTACVNAKGSHFEDIL